MTLPTYLLAIARSKALDPLYLPTYLPTYLQGYKAMKAGLIADTYLEAMEIVRHKKSYAECSSE